MDDGGPSCCDDFVYWTRAAPHSSHRRAAAGGSPEALARDAPPFVSERRAPHFGAPFSVVADDRPSAFNRARDAWLYIGSQRCPRSGMTAGGVIKFIDEITGDHIDSLPRPPCPGPGIGGEGGLERHGPFLARTAATLLCENGDIAEEMVSTDHDTGYDVEAEAPPGSGTGGAVLLTRQSPSLGEMRSAQVMPSLGLKLPRCRERRIQGLHCTCRRRTLWAESRPHPFL